MYNANLTADDVRALDKMKDLPAALREQVEQIKKTLPVSVELPREIYEDAQRRAEVQHSTPEQIISQFYRCWIAKSLTCGPYPSTPKGDCLPAEDDKCAHYDCSHRKTVSDAKQMSLQVKLTNLDESNISPIALQSLLEGMKIDASEFRDLACVTDVAFHNFMHNRKCNTQTKINISSAASKISSGEYVTGYDLVTSGILASRLNEYCIRTHTAKTRAAKLIRVGDEAVTAILNKQMPVRYDTVRRFRKFFNI